jgi:hypothetical protein
MNQKDQQQQPLWERLSNVPDHFKTPMVTAEGKPLTNVNPHEAVRRMTEIFGPCGSGWGIKSGQVMDLGDILQMEISVWYKPFILGLDFSNDPSQIATVVAWGGVKRDTGDPDLYKKMFTNGFSKAVSYLGFASEVYLQKNNPNPAADPVAPPASPPPPPPSAPHFVHSDETPRDWAPLADYYISTKLPSLCHWKWRIKDEGVMSFSTVAIPNGAWNVLAQHGFKLHKGKNGEKTFFHIVPLTEVQEVYGVNPTATGGNHAN